MAWLGWTMISLISVIVLVTYSICKAASDADDRMLGVHQYETN